jgi:hypothetical protein
MSKRKKRLEIASVENLKLSPKQQVKKLYRRPVLFVIGKIGQIVSKN